MKATPFFSVSPPPHLRNPHINKAEAHSIVYKLTYLSQKTKEWYRHHHSFLLTTNDQISLITVLQSASKQHMGAISRCTTPFFGWYQEHGLLLGGDHYTLSSNSVVYYYYVIFIFHAVKGPFINYIIFIRH